ncbi:MAG: cell division protein ZapB [Candidatus Krumholzibacteriota bacterium]|nr:cell division protein ZapB [Candidatus Krumholzibacteriota bacterium]
MENNNLDSFKLLESKISKAADMVVRLKEEKKKFEDENKELKDEIKVLYNKNEELTQKVDTLQNDNQNRNDFEKVREEIGTRIEAMLEKLEEIDI